MEGQAFEIKTYVPITPPPVRAFEVPADVTIDVLTDQFPEAVAGDYIQVDEQDKPVRAWTKAEFEASYQLQA